MYSPYILRYRYCRHVTLDVFWLKGKRRSVTSKPRFHSYIRFKTVKCRFGQVLDP